MLIHTVPPLADEFARLAAEVMPGVETVSVVDEGLLRRTIEQGELTADTSRRLAELVGAAEQDGADAILVTCSTLGPAVDDARSRCDVPLLRVDEAMAAEAVRSGTRIGVVATLHTTLEPTVDLIDRVARERERPVEVVAHLCHGAFEAVVSGDTARHDALVRAAVEELAAKVDVIVLAQASMARALDALPSAPPVPVLTSPRLAVEHAARVLRRDDG